MTPFDRYILIEAKRILDDVEDATKYIGTPLDPPRDRTEALIRFKELTEAKRACQEQADHFSKEASVLEQQLVEEFAASGDTLVRNNGTTFFVARERSVTAVADKKHELVDVMRALGFDDFIVVQPQRLASWAREMLDDEATGNALPAEVQPLVKVHEMMRLRMRSS